nr:hypothetical protein [Tanacetum cinerariifolium]
MTMSVRLGPDPIFDDPVNNLKRDNARSSSVGVVGSMLTSFDRETNSYDFWTSSVVTVLYDSPRAFSAAFFVMVKMTVEFLRLMLRVLAVFLYWSMFLWVLKLFQGSGLNFSKDCVIFFLPFQGDGVSNGVVFGFYASGFLISSGNG